RGKTAAPPGRGTSRGGGQTSGDGRGRDGASGASRGRGSDQRRRQRKVRGEGPTRARRLTGRGFKRAATAKVGRWPDAPPGRGASRSEGSSRRRRREWAGVAFTAPACAPGMERAESRGEAGAARPEHLPGGPNDVYRRVATPGGPASPRRSPRVA